MSTSVELSVGLLRKFAEFTKKLSPEQLEALVAGDLKFGLIEPPVDVEKLAAELRAMPTREAASGHLDGLKLKASEMKDLAKAIGAPISGATTKNAYRDRIVEHTVGFLRNSQTIRHGSWSS